MAERHFDLVLDVGAAAALVAASSGDVLGIAASIVKHLCSRHLAGQLLTTRELRVGLVIAVDGCYRECVMCEREQRAARTRRAGVTT